ncbi:hypothetical protein TWF506_004398 [Arthrobotrys conoides]|uniref:Uncharacterized protein n=1 Tax=Arthrobotrys conoides TaxID=74498 RepID=A0AAN8RIJ7_9PEZI
MCWTIYHCLCKHPYPRPSVSDACYCDLYRVSSLRKVCLPCEELDKTEDGENERKRWEKLVGRNEALNEWLSRGGSGDRWFDESVVQEEE